MNLKEHFYLKYIIFQKKKNQIKKSGKMDVIDKKVSGESEKEKLEFLAGCLVKWSG